MKIKKFVAIFTAMLMMVAVLISSNVFAENNPDTTQTYTFAEIEEDYVAHDRTVTPSEEYNITKIGNSEGELLNHYCGDSSVGFDKRENTNWQPTKFSDTYNTKYTMTDDVKNEIQNLNVKPNKKLYEGDIYNQIRALADLMYLGNSTEKYQEYMRTVLKTPITGHTNGYFYEVSDYGHYPDQEIIDYYGLDTIDEYLNDFLDITPAQIKAVQQLAIWSLVHDIDFAYGITSPSCVLEEGPIDGNNDQAVQINYLYKYLVEKAKTNATNGIYGTNTVYLYVDSNEADEQPILEIIPGETPPEGNVDFALRKFITSITMPSGTERTIQSREPAITAEEKTKLSNGNATFDGGTTLAKTHSKTPLEVGLGDRVVYTIRVYNEGTADGYAGEVKDYLPEGLVFVPTIASSINRDNGWTLSSDGRTVTTTKTANTKLAAFDINKSENEQLSYTDLYIECIVTGKNLKNVAEISQYLDEDKNEISEDIDSQPGNLGDKKNNYNPGKSEEGIGYEDDDDYEDLLLKEFDLALRKHISKVTTGETVTTYNAAGERVANVDATRLNNPDTTAQYKHRKDPIVVETGSKVEYTLTIYNEGEMDGRATKVIDRLPSGVKFLRVVSGNFESDGTYSTTNNTLTLVRKSGNTTNLPAYTSGTPANEAIIIECEVTAQADEDNDKVYTNIAWIAEHKNLGDYPDRDSNNVIPEGGTTPITTPTIPTLVTTNKGYTNNDNHNLADKTHYFAGQEDDDDFEKVIIKSLKGSYNVVLVKEDANGEQLNETATFEVDGVEKQVTGRLTIVENKKITPDNVSTVDTYIIKETVPPDAYCAFDGTIKVEVYKKQDGERYVVDKIKYYVDDVEVTSNREDLNVYLSTDGNIYVEVKDYQFDLALRKFITEINDVEVEEPRKPDVKTVTFEDETTTFKKPHTKEKLGVEPGDKVLYTIRVYNEGEVDGYAEEVTDYLPEGLTMVPYTVGDGSTNDIYGWQQDGKTITTDYLSKAKGEERRITTGDTVNPNLIKAYNTQTKVLDYRDVYIECTVNSNATKTTNLKNVAEITDDADADGDEVTDRDSTPKDLTDDEKSNYNPGTSEEGKGYEDDDDYEDLKIAEFDLALRKYITKVTRTENEQEVVIKSSNDLKDRNPNADNKIDASKIPNTADYKHRKDPVIVKAGDFVYYNLTVYNEGDIAGRANQIVDQLPEGVTLVTTETVTSEKGNVYSIAVNTSTNVVTLTTLGTKNLAPFSDGTIDKDTVTLKCEVTADTKTGADKIYTNIAYISQYYNAKKQAVVETDRDSQTTSSPTGKTLVTPSTEKGYLGNTENTNKDWADKNQFFKGEQDDDDFEKIIIYKEPEIHKGVKTVENQDSGYDDNQDETIDENEKHAWVINSTVPVNVEDYEKYVIVDDIDYRLNYVPGSVKVFKGSNVTNENPFAMQWTEDNILTEGVDYTLEYTPHTGNEVSSILGQKYSGTLKLTFIDENKEASEKFKSCKGGYIVIGFNTTFAKDENGKLLAEVIGKEIPNKAELEYTNESGENKKKPTEKPEVHTGGITLFKYYKDNDQKVGLKDAEFEIYRTAEDAANKTNAVQKATSGENGLVAFAGLEYGEDAKDSEANKKDDGTYVQGTQDSRVIPGTKYWIVETKAPKGYKTVTTPIEVTINNDSYKDDVEVLIREEESKESTNRLVENQPLEFDLSLRKFITKVNETEPKVSREPKVDTTKLKDGTSTTATYTHPKDAVDVVNGDVVTYKLRVYNEGQVDGFAEIVTDDIPTGVEFLPNNETNKAYRWEMYAEKEEGKTYNQDDIVTLNINEENKVKDYVKTDDASKAVIIRTDYLSKAQGEARMKAGDTENPNLLKAYNAETDKLDYRDLEIVFKVTEPNGSKRVITNYAQISNDSDENGNDVDDRDSTPDRWNKGEDDQDIENLKVPEFDLALRKWVTQAIVIENGETTVTETGHDAWDDPEEIVKVELHRRKLADVTVKFRYSIRVYNQGELEGYAKEVKDYIPDGLMFIQEDNPDWKVVGDNIITTDKLANTLLKTGEYADVEVLLTWINSEDNMGLKVNTAEISKDYNEKGVPDKDSTPDNKKPGEDDIDDAPVMLSIETGEEKVFIILGITAGALIVLAGGIFLIKKYVM